jgi:low affinity Fe/Cu permease
MLIVAEISLGGMVRVQARQFSENWQVTINTRIASLVPIPLQVASRQSSKEIIQK